MSVGETNGIPIAVVVDSPNEPLLRGDTSQGKFFNRVVRTMPAVSLNVVDIVAAILKSPINIASLRSPVPVRKISCMSIAIANGGKIFANNVMKTVYEACRPEPSRTITEKFVRDNWVISEAEADADSTVSEDFVAAWRSYE